MVWRTVVAAGLLSATVLVPMADAKRDGTGSSCTGAETGRCAEKNAKKKAGTVQRESSDKKKKTGRQADKNKGSSSFPTSGRALACSKKNRGQLGKSQKAACDESGVAFVKHPIENYKLDEHNDGGIDGDPIREFAADSQNAFWMAWVWIIHGLLMLIEWATHIDEISRKLFVELGLGARRVHYSLGAVVSRLAVLLLVASFTVSLARGRLGQGIRGLAESWIYILITLAIIASPATTLGDATKVSGKLTRTTMASVTKTPEGAERKPDRSSRARSVGTIGTLHNTLVLRQWCLANFGDVGWCMGTSGHDGRKLKHATGKRLARELCRTDDVKKCDKDLGPTVSTGGKIWDKAKCIADPTNFGEDCIINKKNQGSIAKWLKRADKTYRPVDLWLSWPPGDKGVRNAMYEIYREKDHPFNRYIKMQQGDAVYYPRGVVVGLGGFALIGAALLLLVIGAHLLSQVAKTAVLIVIAPAVSVVAAGGEWGRRKWKQWILALLAALVWGVVAAFFLAAVAYVLGAIASLSTKASGGSWAIYLALIAAITWGALAWYGVNLYKRSFGSKSAWQQAARAGAPPGQTIGQVRDAVGGMRGTVGQTGRRVSQSAGRISQPFKATRNWRRRRKAEKTDMRLEDQVVGVVGDEAKLAQQWEEKTKPGLQRERRSLDDSLRGYDRGIAEAHAEGDTPPSPSEAQKKLLARRGEIDRELSSPAAVKSKELRRMMARNQGDVPQAMIADRKNRRLELARDPEVRPTDPAYLKEVGLHDKYKNADQADRSRITAQVKEQLDKDRKAARMQDRTSDKATRRRRRERRPPKVTMPPGSDGSRRDNAARKVKNEAERQPATPSSQSVKQKEKRPRKDDGKPNKPGPGAALKERMKRSKPGRGRRL